MFAATETLATPDIPNQSVAYMRITECKSDGEFWGIRFTLVKNYIAFYVVSEENHTIYIVRFLYGKRDWINILKQGFSLK